MNISGRVYSCLFIVALPALTLWGCGSASDETEQSDIFSRSPQITSQKPGERVGPLRVQVMGPVIQGVPGRNGYRDPVEGVPVTFNFRSDGDVQAIYRRHKKTGKQTPIDAQRAFTYNPVDGPPFRFVVKEQAAEGASEDGRSAKVLTDRDGYAEVQVKLGAYSGDVRVEAEIRDRDGSKRDVFFLIKSGIRVEPHRRESVPGGSVDVVVSAWEIRGLRRRDLEKSGDDSGDSTDEGAADTGDDEEDTVSTPGSNKRPHVVAANNRRIDLNLLESSQRHGARLAENRDRTNRFGKSTVRLRLGNRSGVYQVIAEGVPIEYYAVDLWELLFYFVGGISLFVVGLRIYANGLIIHLSQFLRFLTGAFTEKQSTGFIGGATIGAVFHSSSAVLSRLVSFANGGILIAAVAAGQILGANFGKTIFFQLVAFNFITFLAVPLLAIGAVALLLPRRYGSRSWGNVFAGIGMALLGWQFFERAAELAALSPSLRATLESWDPAASKTALLAFWVFLMDVMLAALLAFLLRNSNVVVAAVLVFAVAGLISFDMVIPCVIGSGLGSALSVFVGTIGRKREARRLALTQVVYQVFGGLGLVAFTLIRVGDEPLILRLADWLTPGLLFNPQPEHTLHHLAMLYSVFHLVNGLALLSIRPWIQRIVDRVIPADPIRDGVKPFRLDPTLIEVPSMALTQATREVVYLGEIARKSVAEAFDAFRYQDLNLTDQIARREESIQSIQSKVSQYLLWVNQNNLSAREAAQLEALQIAAANLGRTGDVGEQLRHATTRFVEQKLEVPEDIMRELTDLFELIINQFENVLHLLENQDPRVEENANKVGERIAKSASRIETLWIQRLQAADSSEGMAVSGNNGLVLMLTNQAHEALATAGGHLTDIAKRIRILSSS